MVYDSVWMLHVCVCVCVCVVLSRREIQLKVTVLIEKYANFNGLSTTDRKYLPSFTFCLDRNWFPVCKDEKRKNLLPVEF
jgi:hypothetical protein